MTLVKIDCAEKQKPSFNEHTGSLRTEGLGVVNRFIEQVVSTKGRSQHCG